MNETADAYEEAFFRIQSELDELMPRALEGVMSADGMTPPQAFSLKVLKEKGTSCRMSDLAALRFHTPAAMTGTVDRLVRLGLVQRKSDANDRRVILLELTDRGLAVHMRIEKKVHIMMRRFFESMPKKERETTMRMFLKLKDFLKDEINAQKKT